MTIHNGDKSKIFGELWLDEKGKAHFVCHNKGLNFPETLNTFIKFRNLLDRQIKDRDKCPYGDAVKQNLELLALPNRNPLFYNDKEHLGGVRIRKVRTFYECLKAKPDLVKLPRIRTEMVRRTTWLLKLECNVNL